MTFCFCFFACLADFADFFGVPALSAFADFFGVDFFVVDFFGVNILLRRGERVERAELFLEGLGILEPITGKRSRGGVVKIIMLAGEE